MDVLSLLALVLTGFTACAEFGSYAFVHPVIRRLPPPQMIAFEQGLLRTFGRAFPILMPVTGVLLVLEAALGGGVSAELRWAAVVLWVAATVTTLVVNVPINVTTGRWDPERPPDGWREARRRWDVFQAVRAWLLLAAFLLLSLSLVVD